ncbi:hypothetical protein GGR57DRAFT_493524 [Xylariaceae sp. FL1272]|nr:hypothetical protein GGR57DRAFT_493524 [Xylariaceae sp. FL1272]
MQLSMGEGKSSVIVPIVAAALANCSQLERIVVAKPQAKQMHEVLVSKLGRMTSKRVVCVPLSRDLKLNEFKAETLFVLLRDCMSSGGVLLIQPKHILSLKLMCIECALSEERSIKKILIDMQDFLDRQSRDIIDESDETFSAKHELVFTMGPQESIDYSPNCWICIQQVLDIVEYICEKGLPCFTMASEQLETKSQILAYITDPSLSPEMAESIVRSLDKRWRVNYGLDPTRTPPTKTVPFRGKNVPALRSEFSHLDVVAVLTALCYYYKGLDVDDLASSFKHLIKSDLAEQEYQLCACLADINLDDWSLFEYDIFLHLYRAKRANDYFLTHFVFPRELRVYSQKPSASGWDIAKEKTLTTTGFSSTNDSRNLLPLSICQNTMILIPKALIGIVATMKPEVRVLSDVGAQILELDNLGVARCWLQKMPDHTRTLAVVFVNDDDEFTVVDRQGRIESLRPSAYIDQLALCLVYLDETHTRGTDLKLPQDYRAVVTLGGNTTKDALVQACLRMRSLEEGQSIMFCVPDEIRMKIHERIIDPEMTVDDESISVIDILAWDIKETWDDAHRNILQWATQGRLFELHQSLWRKLRKSQDAGLSLKHMGGFVEDEAKSPRAHPSRFNAIDSRCAEFANTQRELAPEIQQEQQYERSEDATAALGHLFQKATAIFPAFGSLKATSAARHFDPHQFNSKLLVTTDFARTRPVQWILTGSYSRDSNDVKMMIIISSYEAEKLWQDIESSHYFALHLYAPRSNLTQRPLDDLDLYTIPRKAARRIIPRSLIIELNSFPGSLYMESI